MSMLSSIVKRILPPPVQDLAQRASYRGRVAAAPAVPEVTESPDDAAFRCFVRSSLDPEAYLEAYPDVAAAGIDPVSHWLECGLYEGRLLRGVIVWRGDAARQVRGDEWQFFVWHDDTIAVRTESPDDAAFRCFVRSSLDPEAYLEAYPDVAAAGIDPVSHWLEYGLKEGRLLRGVIVRRDGAARQVRGAEWQFFVWRDETIAVRKAAPLPQSLLRQIMQQARHDPAVLAPGALALANLRRVNATDLLDRDGVDVPALLAAVPARPGTILIIPAFLAGGAEKYAADLTDALLVAGGGPMLVLVTDQTAEEAHGWEKLSILAPFLKVPVTFWRDACGGSGYGSFIVLARFLNLLRPERVVVINSRVGLEAVSHFGRGLTQFARLCCAYFSMGVDGLGAPYGTRFPRRTLPFALALTDNEPMADTLRRLHGEVPGPGIALLPARMAPAAEAVFAARLEARRRHVAAAVPRGSRRWAWVSRVEPFKGTAILGALAMARPEDRFEVFGPVAGSLAELGLDLPNILHRGTLPDVAAADFTGHDGFLFTSLFEGMPNTVLEMSQHAIPMVLADVGGLRQTFDDWAAAFVRHAPDTASTTAAFARGLDRMAALTADQSVAMALAARAQAMARHAPAAHVRGASQIFGLA